MARTIRYINTASSGGDGTTNGTAGGTAAFSGLVDMNTDIGAIDASAITTESVTVNGYQFDNIAIEVICDMAGGNDTTLSSGRFQIQDNAITGLDATHRFLLRAADNSWPVDLEPETGYTLKAASNTNYPLFRVHNDSQWYSGGLCMAGICIVNTATGNATSAYNNQNTSDATATGWNEYFACIFENSASASDDAAVDAGSGDFFYACRAKSANSYAWDISTQDVALYSCLGIDSGGNGQFTTVAYDAENYMSSNVFFNNTGTDMLNGMTYSGAGYCDWEAVEDANSDSASNYGTNAVTGLTSGDFAETTNYTPAASGALDGVGPDLVTATGLTYSVNSRVDANGNTRPTGDTWTLGPFEASAAGSSVPPLMHHYTKNMD